MAVFLLTHHLNMTNHFLFVCCITTNIQPIYSVIVEQLFIYEKSKMFTVAGV